LSLRGNRTGEPPTGNPSSHAALDDDRKRIHATLILASRAAFDCQSFVLRMVSDHSRL
jgi:hypothetical protein